MANTRTLISEGIDVTHVIDSNKTEPHPFTSAAQVIEGELSYRAAGMI